MIINIIQSITEVSDVFDSFHENVAPQNKIISNNVSSSILNVVLVIILFDVLNNFYFFLNIFGDSGHSK